jgi:uncharacterized protein YqeY
MSSEIISTIKLDRIAAMKARDEKTKAALSILLGEIDRNLGTKTLTDELAISVINKMCKTFEENIDTFTKAGKDFTDDKNKLEVISKYRPSVMGADATRGLVAQIKAGLSPEDQGNVGKVMAALKPYASRIDMKVASAIVRGG